MHFHVENERLRLYIPANSLRSAAPAQVCHSQLQGWSSRIEFSNLIADAAVTVTPCATISNKKILPLRKLAPLIFLTENCIAHSDCFGFETLQKQIRRDPN